MQFLAITWTVNPDIISSPITVRWYGLLFATAFFLGYYLLQRIFKKDGVPEEWLDKILVYVMVGTVVGARLGHVFFYDWDYYSKNLSEIPMVWKGGLASHGAGIGIITALWLFSRYVTKKNILWSLDRVAITVALGAFFIRLGNLMNSEIVGKPTGSDWGFIFPLRDCRMPLNQCDFSTLPVRHPTQLYESFSYLIVFGILISLFSKNDWKSYQGRTFGLFMALLFTVRFLIEFLKENQSAFEDNLSLNMGQNLSIPFILVGLYFITISKKTA